MRKREKLNTNASVGDVLVQMAEGNPGAVRVLSLLLQDNNTGEGLMLILDLDDMGMRGSQIWVAYKDYCKEDIGRFKQCLRDRDPKMVETVNRECVDRRAVAHGASS